MRPEQQRICIAEACGWRVKEVEHFKLLCPPYSGETGMCCGKHLTDEEVLHVGLEGDEGGAFRIPDYLSDLNAMHEAEKILQDENRSHYYHWLYKECGAPYAVSATAAQRAEAFLRTIGKWAE